MYKHMHTHTHTHTTHTQTHTYILTHAHIHTHTNTQGKKDGEHSRQLARTAARASSAEVSFIKNKICFLDST